MKKVFTFIRNALLMGGDDYGKVGLSQFRAQKSEFSFNKNPLNSKDVKISDLLRRS